MIKIDHAVDTDFMVEKKKIKFCILLGWVMLGIEVRGLLRMRLPVKIER